MTKLFVRAILLLLSVSAAAQTTEQAHSSKQLAKAVTITRDDWGIAHVHGRTDADAVFGMIYAQCEDDFNRVETSYLVSLGRLSEAEGEARIWQDLRQRLFVDPEDLKAQYASSPDWLKRLMNSWADGINFYLAQHPAVHPRVITHWEPWMALSFTEGSIGGDIQEKIDLTKLRNFYNEKQTQPNAASLQQPPLNDSPVLSLLDEIGNVDAGSNGIAIGPSDSATHHSLLLINPHTSFFFRSELQVTSDEGLNAYGAATWGQFFIYQGFNDRAGWMHTTSNVDAVDEYAETLVPSNDPAKRSYKYAGGTRPFQQKQITLSYRADGAVKQRTFDVCYSHHGPVVRLEAGKWITIRLMNKPVAALEQSFLRTKARSYAEYKKTMELKANSSNNTIFADADGDIAYWHGNFIPKRNTKFDFTKPVDGSDPATEWGDLMSLDEVPHLLNPTSGYLFNVNNPPWHGAGESSLQRGDYPSYVEQGTETSRGVHASMLLASRHGLSVDSLRALAYDSYLPWFQRTLPSLIAAWDALPATDAEKSRYALQIGLLRTWDRRWAADSIPTTLAVMWAEAIGNPVEAEARRDGVLWEDYVVQHVDGTTMLRALEDVSDRLTKDFGTWKVPWGKYNRFQRLNDDISPNFSDSGPSIPVAFTPSQWGSLASFQSRTYPGTKLRYGSNGNSFVAVIEFGPRIHAVAVTAGGESGDPASKHFNDEAERYATGNLREVYFYPDQLKGHTEKTYHPGD